MPKKTKKTLLVLYHLRGSYPLRHSIKSHLFCWRQYSSYRTVYFNVAFQSCEDIIAQGGFDAIIFHTSYLGLRWKNPAVFLNSSLLSILSESSAQKIMLPQDEFVDSLALCKFAVSANVDLILSCAASSEYEKIYPELQSKKISISRVLTGYIDDKTASAIKYRSVPLAKREFDLSYRAWDAEYWIGEHGRAKSEIAPVFVTACEDKGLTFDISVNSEDTVSGQQWVEFLSRSRAVLGVEGGASLLDVDGSIRDRTRDYIQKNPNANFEAARAACFPIQDKSLSLFCLSPRHLEAAMTKTCQILIEGEYNGILRANIDYFALKKDYSNVEEALLFLQDDKRVQTMIDTAYDHIVAPGIYNYSNFVRFVEAKLSTLEKIPSHTNTLPFLTYLLHMTRDWLYWYILRLEVFAQSQPKWFKPVKSILRPIYKALVKF